MAAGSSPHDAPRRPVILAALLLLSLSPAARADDWKFDVVVLKPGVRADGTRVLKGLLIDYKEGAEEVEIRVVHREDGQPTRVEPSTYTYNRSKIESVEQLDAEERALLEKRVKAITLTGKELARRIQELKLDPTDIDFGKASKKKGFRYRDEDEHFVLESNVKEEVFRRSAERLAQVYNAYAHALPPQNTSAKPTTILLAGTQADYQSLLKERGLNIFNPAFYDPAANQIVCGCDLVRLGELLEQARADNQKVSDDLKKREEELKKVYGEKRVPREVMRPINEARQRLTAAEAANSKLFDEATRVLFQRLYHESFHAYLANFVYTGEHAEMPRWLNEGLAQLFETAIFEADEVRLGRPDPARLKRARAALAADELVSVKDLLRSSPKQFVVAHASDKETSDRYYLASWALAYYLASAGKILNTQRLDDYCRATRAHEDPAEAFLTLVGSKDDGLAAFEAKFHAYIRNLQPNGTVGKPK
jgi:hypothetical protein